MRHANHNERTGFSRQTVSSTQVGLKVDFSPGVSYNHVGGGENLTQRVSLKVDGLTVVGEVYYPAEAQTTHPALCICHGIPASPPNPSDRGYALLAERSAGEGFITCIFNFRGTGESEGNLDLLGWTRDLEAVIIHLSQLEGVNTSRLSLIGFSGGAATAAYVAARDKRVSALVTCASPAEFSQFTSEKGVREFLKQCRDVGTVKDDDFPPSIEEWVGHFHQVSPINFIEKVSPRPLLIIHGEKDELIDPSHAHMLFEKAGEPKELAMIPDGEHRLRTNEEAMNKALDWLKRVNSLS